MVLVVLAGRRWIWKVRGGEGSWVALGGGAGVRVRVLVEAFFSRSLVRKRVVRCGDVRL